MRIVPLILVLPGLVSCDGDTARSLRHGEGPIPVDAGDDSSGGRAPVAGGPGVGESNDGVGGTEAGTGGTSANPQAATGGSSGTPTSDGIDAGGTVGMNGGSVSGGSMNGGSVNGGSMNGGSVNGGSVNGGSGKGGSMNGGSVNGGSVNGGSANGGSVGGVNSGGMGGLNGGGPEQPGGCLGWDIDVPSVAVSGAITVDGAAGAPNYGLVSLVRGTDKVELGDTSEGSYSTRVVPGTYDVVYNGNMNGLRIPLRTGVTIAASGATVVDVDVPLTVVNEAGPPRGVGDEGSVSVTGLFQVNSVPSPSALGLSLFVRSAEYAENSGWTSASPISPSGYEAHVNPGRYQFSYMNLGSSADFETWLPRNGMPVVAEVEVPDVDFFEFDVDIPSVPLTGIVAINGQPPVGTVYATLVSDTLGTAWLEYGSDGSYAVEVIPGTYDLLFEHGSTGPQNTRARLETAVVIAAARENVLDVDVPSVEVSGTIRLGGAALDGTAELGTLYLATDEGDHVLLEVASNGSYAVDVVPGLYDVTFAVGDDGPVSQAPLNTRGKVMRGVLVEPGSPVTLDVDVTSTVVSGSITIAGAVVDADVDGGRIWLRDGHGDDVPLGWTADGEYSARVVPGTYDVFYEGTLPTNVAPRNRDAKLGCLMVP